MADVPEGVPTGRIVFRASGFRADDSDVGDQPNLVELNGRIIITPTVSLMQFPEAIPPFTAVLVRDVCPVINGVLYRPGSTVDALPVEGVPVIASAQPGATPDFTQYRASFELTGPGGAAVTNPPSVTFNVPADGVVDLSLLIVSAPPQPGTVVVVSSEDRIAAEQAAAAAATDAATASTAASDAVAAKNAAEIARGDATEAATAANTSAIDAAGAATDAQTVADGIPDAVAAEIATQSARILQGTGMPNGVVTATPGTLYVDTASTNGASTWRKATGTGNTGWVVIDGDTGDRTVPPLNGWTTSTGTLRIRRFGDLVTLAGYLVRGTDPHLYTAPTGFRIAANTVPLVPYGVTTPSPVQAGEMLTSGTVKILGTSGGTHYFSVTYPTKDPWPTTLPGTPA